MGRNPFAIHHHGFPSISGVGRLIIKDIMVSAGGLASLYGMFGTIIC
ncbi:MULTISPECIES: DUF417 family protein [Porphyromonas]